VRWTAQASFLVCPRRAPSPPQLLGRGYHCSARNAKFTAHEQAQARTCRVTG
jgi:hypothetical protein